MLTLVESTTEKVRAQRALQARLERSWQRQEKRVVVWRPDSRQITVHHNGRYWFGSIAPNEDDLTPRYWNPLGEYRANGNLQIAVELNVPTDSNSKRVSGFFAKDTPRRHSLADAPKSPWKPHRIRLRGSSALRKRGPNPSRRCMKRYQLVLW